MEPAAHVMNKDKKQGSPSSISHHTFHTSVQPGVIWHILPIIDQSGTPSLIFI